MKAIGVICIEWSLLTFSSCFFFTRLYVRVIQRGGPFCRSAWNWSDIFVAMAWFTVLAEALVDSYLAHLNFPVTDIPGVPYPPKIAMLINKITTAEAAIYWWVMDFVKASMLCFYDEFIGRSVMPTTWMFIRFVGVLIFCGTVASPIVSLAYCLPIYKRWTNDEKLWLSCQTEQMLLPAYLFFCLFEVITDILVIIIPFFVLSKMQNLPFRQKLGVGMMFGLGIFSLVCSTVYTYFLVQIALQIQNNYSYLSFFVAMAEQNTAVTVACMPAFRKLLLSRGVTREPEISTQEVANSKRKATPNSSFPTMASSVTKETDLLSRNTSVTVVNRDSVMIPPRRLEEEVVPS